MGINSAVYKTVLIVIITALLATIYSISSRPDQRLHIIFCDVGQGDGILIKTPGGSQIIIDAGYDNKMLNCIEQHTPFQDKTIECLAFVPAADFLYKVRASSVHFLCRERYQDA